MPLLQATSVKSQSTTEQENHLAMCYLWKIKNQKGYCSDVANEIQSSAATLMWTIPLPMCAERRRIRHPFIATKAAVLSGLQMWNKTYSIWKHPQSLDVSLDFLQVTFCTKMALLSPFFFTASLTKLYGIKSICDTTSVILLVGDTPQILILYRFYKRQNIWTSLWKKK